MVIDWHNNKNSNEPTSRPEYSFALIFADFWIILALAFYDLRLLSDINVVFLLSDKYKLTQKQNPFQSQSNQSTI